MLFSNMLATLIIATIFTHNTRSVAGQWPGSGPDICAVPSTFSVRPETTCSDASSSKGSGAMLQFQIGETEDFQILMRKESDPVDDLVGGMRNVNISCVVQDANADATCAISRVAFVNTKRSPRYPGSGGGWRSDLLLPLLESDIFDVPNAVTQSIWVSLSVGRNARPGNYTAEVRLSYSFFASQNKTVRESTSVPVNLTIWNVQLPSLAQSMLGTAWSGSWTSATFEPYYKNSFDWNRSKQAWYDMMTEHRMPADSLYLSSPRPIDDYVYLAKSGARWFGILDVTSLGNVRSDEESVHHGVEGACANYTDVYVEKLLSTLQPIVSELEARDLLQYAYVYGFDENPRSCEPQVRKLFGATKKRFPKLRTAAVLNWDEMPTDIPVDVWILSYSSFNVTSAQAWTDVGKVQWHYHCIEPHDVASLNTFIERPAYQPRLLMWLASKNHLQFGAPSGWLYYAVNLWRPPAGVVPAFAANNMSTPFSVFPPGNYIWKGQYNDIFANGDGQYLYPCNEGRPCASIRLAALRDGLEDWELFSRTTSAFSAVVERVVRGPRDWAFTGHSALENVRSEAFSLLSS